VSGEYISREAAENAFCKYMGFTSGRVALASELIFAKIPAADVVEVVRCENCTNCEPVWTPSNSLFFCVKLNKPVNLGFYCAYGKRKDGGQDE
jgi:hypothetical protein